MGRRCGNAKCEKHHIRLRGNAKYCPACGNETFAIPLFPFYIYASKKGLQWVAGAILTGVLIIYAGVPAVTTLAGKVQRDNAAKEARVEALPEFWKTIYFAAPKEDWHSNRIKMLKNMVEKATAVPPLDSEGVDLLLRVFPNDEKEAMEIITPYLSQ